MSKSLVSLSRLVEQLQRLPGIGHKSAQRLAFHLLRTTDQDVRDLIGSITEAREKIQECTVCCNYADGDICPICSNPARDTSVICVVEDPRDVMAFERTREYNGVYHVLHGILSPMESIGPDQLRVKELLHRIASQDVKEVIMATNPTVEGEATAMYLAKLIKPFGVAVSRLAYGIPVGGDLEYADEFTLRRSLEGRNLL